MTIDDNFTRHQLEICGRSTPNNRKIPEITDAYVMGQKETLYMFTCAGQNVSLGNPPCD